MFQELYTRNIVSNVPTIDYNKTHESNLICVYIILQSQISLNLWLIVLIHVIGVY